MLLINSVPATGSTNDDLSALAREGAPEGTWLRAERQTGGKGRQGRAWESPPGNLYASTLIRLRPTDPPAPGLALVAGVALHEAVSLHTENVQIKWPNDLMAQGAKLAGILLEREGEAVVAGFGVNLTGSPKLPDRVTTSVTELSGHAPEAAIFLEVLREAVERWVDRWRTVGLDPIRRSWTERAHPLGTALVTAEGVGLFDGLDETGALKLRLADGTIRLIHAGDVFLI